MSLLKELVQEMAVAAATGAHAVAGSPGTLFGGGIVDPKRSKKKQRKMMRRAMNVNEAIAPKSEETNFDAGSVISKIDAAEKKARANDDTTAFGLEDEDGQIVKVYVKNDQAEDFEQALAVALSGEDEDDDDENTSTEIAEVIFKLKDRFEIVDVEWNTFEGDEDEEQEVEGDLEAGGEEGADPMGDELATGDEAGAEGDLDGEVEMDDGSEEAATSALQSVIDVMKADADAKKAESEAKEAEAKAKEAEYAAKSSAAKVQQEEQILDMETYNKDQSDKKKEADQLAKLAKFKHDTATTAETQLSTEAIEDEEENDGEERTGITIDELSSLIMSNLRAN